MVAEVTIYYLEMTSPEAHRRKASPNGLSVVEAEVKDFRFNRFLYQLVGEAWSWTDKLSLPDTDWIRYAESDTLRTWVAYNRGSIAGYYELLRDPDDQVQIAYFGLTPKFIGRGFGGYLLSHAIDSAWTWGDIARVWVHTCTLDHPSALSNYQSRGFRLYKTEID